MGAEIEYPVSGISREGERMDQSRVLKDLISSFKAERPHLCDATGQGIFTPTLRIYADCNKLELATCECTSPAQVVAQIIAGERLLAEQVRRHNSGHDQADELLVYRCNVDYSGTGSTWGAHESYLTSAEPLSLAGPLTAHLVSRILYTGAGGWRIDTAGLKYALCPRALLFEDVVSQSSTRARPIYHLRPESLCRGWHRVHVILGSALCSHWAMFLKFGPTALIVRLAEKAPGALNRLELADPLEALRTVATDFECSKTLKLANGKSMTAIEVQRGYLKAVRDHLDKPWQPPWVEDVCGRWDLTLTLLENNSDSLLGRVDWMTKRALYARHLAKNGIDWDQVALLNSLCRRHRLPDVALPEAVERLRVRNIKFLAALHPSARLLKNHGLEWDDYARFLQVRQELFEMDIKFGMLENSIFDALERSKVLTHRVSEVSDDLIESAKSQPPKGTRAWIRGEAIRRFSRRPGEFICNWDGILSSDGRHLDLSDPFEAYERWAPS